MHGVTLLEGKVEKNTLILSETIKLNFELHEKISKSPVYLEGKECFHFMTLGGSAKKLRFLYS